MRLGFVALMLAIWAGIPALADSASDAAANPFTDPPHNGSITSTDKGVSDFTGAIQGADPQTSAPGGFGPAQGGQSGAGAPDNSFYQEKKKADDK